MFKKKNFLIPLLIIVLTIITTTLLYNNKNFVKKHLWSYLPDRAQIIIKLLFNENLVNNFKNDYNIKFLPETQFQKISIKKINLNFLKSKNSTSNNYFETSGLNSFYIESLDNKKTWIINNNAEIFEIDNIEIKTKKKLIYIKKIESNLKAKRVLDTLIIKNEIFISIRESNSNCKKFKIVSANINDETLNFKDFFITNECGRNIQGGRMQQYFHNGSEGILFTTGDNDVDYPDSKPQNKESIYGKIIFQDFISKNYEIFSIGHRNGQGLLVKDNLILMTEHGPRGGDEINKIIYKKNYGWPIASYGEKYSKNNLITYYKKSHENNDFEEPIYAFIPSIGISELISLPNAFSEKWIDNFLVTSLYGRSIFRIKLNKNFDKIIFIEKIFVGERIRDIKYSDNNNMILLAFEEKGQLGILTRSE
jgi:hypothetical protein